MYRLINWAIAVSLITLIIGSFIAWLVSNRLINRLNPVIKGLNKSSPEVAAASEDVSASSQTLAEASSEQAAGIETISSMMEEFSSMTKRNADSAGEADRIVITSESEFEELITVIKNLNTSIYEISKDSIETQKIIKLIDEIASRQICLL